MIDPVGATLAVLVFEALISGTLEAGDWHLAGFRAVAGILKTLLVGGVLGTLGAVAIVVSLRRFWIPDHLQGAVALMLVAVVLTASNVLQEESGLFAVVLMGLILANQRRASVRRIKEFGHDLTAVLVASLFILLAARIPRESLREVTWQGALFLAVLILIARPLGVLLSTWGTGVSWRDRAFLFWMAPRGIVAAAVSSVFGLYLSEVFQYEEAARLSPLTFLVIFGTVAIYGLTAGLLAYRLHLAEPSPQGLLIVGAHSWAQKIAEAVQKEGFRVLLADINRSDVVAARLNGLPAVHLDVLSEDVFENLNLWGIGRLLALTSNDSVNTLAALHFAEIFGQAEVYQLAPSPSRAPAAGKEKGKEKETVVTQLGGRPLFGPEVTFDYLNRRFAEGAVLRNTKLSTEFDFQKFCQLHKNAKPLFLIDPIGRLVVCVKDLPPGPKAGDTLIALIDPPEQPAATADHQAARKGHSHVDSVSR